MTNDDVVQAIHDLMAGIHLQFAVLILVMIFLKYWKRGG